MWLIVGIICAVICGAIAASKGRSVVGWVILGFLFGIISLIILACLSNLEAERQKEAHIANENRRLREQLRQEQIKAESFRQHAAARLDAHDEKLEIDTRQIQPQMPAGQSTRQLTAGQEVDGETAWYYSNRGQNVGPVPQSKIASLIRTGVITGETLVWCEQFSQWQPAGQVKHSTLDFLS